MRLKINLISGSNVGKVIIPINYQYPLSAAIYKIIAQADAVYADFLHEQGYKKENSQKTFKLFTFSDINATFQIKDDRMLMNTNEAYFTVCFHIPEAATNFVKGLFFNQQIDIADKKSKATFTVSKVEILPLWNIPVAPDEVKEVFLKPISPMVVGITNEKNNYDFIPPNDDRFIPALIHHWKEKYRVVYGEEAAEEDLKNIEIAVLNVDKSKSRLLTIKAGTPEETKIRGFVGFQLRVQAKVQVLELALNVGIGVYGSVGFGCVEIRNKR